MKLRNKKTGKIVDFKVHKYIGLSDDGNSVYEPFNGSIDEWEDVPEEPKEFWFVDDVGEVKVIEEDDSEETEGAKQIGNYFSSREEAELAVRKLKAWKRLKDDDFKFIGWYYDVQPISNGRLNIQIRATLDESDNATLSDLDLLFSGGEE